MGTSVYRTVTALGRWFVHYQVVGEQNISGPGLFVANHAGTLGPVVAVTSVRVRLHPWVKADLVDPARSPGHLYREFVHSSLQLDGRLGWGLARLISTITVPLLQGLGCVPVENEQFWTGSALRQSLQLLEQGHSVLIFPGNPREPADPATMIHPFDRGFVQLCRLYRRTTGHDLSLYPLAIHPGSRRVAVGQVLYQRDDADWRTGIHRFSEQVRGVIRTLYLELEV